MYKKVSRILSSINGLDNYIEGTDVYNSELLLRLSDQSLDREQYEITTYQYRPDLIAKDFYGDTSYEGLLLLQAARGLSGFTKGAVLTLLTKSALDSVISNL